MTSRVLLLISAVLFAGMLDVVPAETASSAPRKSAARKKARKRAVRPAAGAAKTAAPTAKASPKAADPAKPVAPKPARTRSETFVVTPAGSLVRNDAPEAPSRQAPVAADGFAGFKFDTTSIGNPDESKLRELQMPSR